LRIGQTELDLIAACLIEDEGFEKKFRLWESGADLGTINYGALRILPFLQTRLSKLKIESYLSPEIRRVHGYFWAKRQLQNETIQRSVIPLMNGFKSVALKGLALETLAYGDSELRPFSDVDFLVSRSDFRLIDERASKFDFRYRGVTPARSFEYFQHAKSFQGNHLELDLHWTFFPLGIDPMYDERIRDRSTINPAQSDWSLPSPTDALIHTLLHGLKPDVVSPIRWLVDAHLLVSRNEIDWDLLQREAEGLGVTSELESSLAFLGQFTKIKHSHFRKGAASFPDLNIARAASRWSVKSDSMWMKRVARIFGSDFIMVRKALAQDGRSINPLNIFRTAIWESIREIFSVLARNSFSSVWTGKWSLRKTDEE
jgi:hypothetical protein